MGAVLLGANAVSAETIEWMKPGHGGGIRAAAISSSLIATGGDDGGIHLWDTRTRAFVKSIPGHTLTVTELAFCSDGSTLASSSADGSVRTHDVATCQSATIFATPVYAQAGLAFQSSSNRLVTLASHGEFSFWNLSDNTLAGKLSLGRSASRFALSPDGQRAAVAMSAEIRIVTLADASFITLSGHSDVVQSLAFSPDGQTLISGAGSAEEGSGDWLVRRWHATTGEPLAPLEGHTGGIRAVAFAPNPNHVISVGWDQNLRVWDVAANRLDFSKTIENFDALAVSPDANFILAGNEVLNLITFESSDLIAHLLPIQSLTFSPDGQSLVSDDNLEPRLWNANDGALIFDWNFSAATRSPEAPAAFTIERAALPVSFSPDGSTVLAQDRLWSRTTGAELSRLALSANALANNWDSFVTFSYDESIAAIRNFPDGEGTLALSHPASRGGSAAAFSADDSLIVTAGGRARHIYAPTTPSLKIWNAATGQLAAEFANDQARPTAVGFSRDRRFVASSSEAGGADLSVWEVDSGRTFLRLRQGSSRASAFSFSPDSTRIAWGHSGGVEIWNLQTLEREAFLTNELQNISALAISPDGQRLAAGRLDGSILMVTMPSTPTEVTDNRPVVTLRFPTRIGATYTIQSSTDFQTWQSLGTVTAGSVQLELTTMAAGDFGFFRLQEQ